ncbi:MAG TPA: cupin domain-containing protein, partial [Thermomicrobiales bacterium]|nr:cupin domain-containing protein [Thermomicrobiales bacterium]
MPAATATLSRAIRPLSIVAVLTLLGMIAGMLASSASAQDATPTASPQATPAASPQAGTVAPSADITRLIEFPLEEFPEAPVSVRLLRITLAPGASSPLHTHPGPEFDYVESGTLTAIAEGEAIVVRDGEETTAAAEEAIDAGELVVFPPGTAMSLVNNGDTDLVLLSAVFHPVSEDVPSTTYPAGEPAAEAFAGVSFTVLGDGIVQDFPDGPATVTLDRIVAPAGADLPATEGAALYSAVDGNFSFAVDGGDVQVSRTASPGLRPNAAPEQEFTLDPGDAAFFPSGVSTTSRTEEDGTVEILRLAVTPDQSIAGDAADISYLGSAEAEVDAPSDGTTADTDPAQIDVGARVVTNDDSVNLREEPTTSADGIDQLGEGVELEVIGGPEEADDLTWYQVEVVGTEGPITGWVAADFISLPGAEEATPEAAAEDAPVQGAQNTPETATDDAPVQGAQNTPEAPGDDGA